MTPNPSNSSDFELSDRLVFEAACSDFEADWTPESRKSLPDCVDRVSPSLKDELVTELVCVDCELSDKAKLPTTVDDYLSLLPDWETAVRRGFTEWSNQTKFESEPLRSRNDCPEQIGDFRIVGKLGEGGMGVVYRAVQQSLGRLVAIKTLHKQYVEKLSIRFQREARAVAMLHHTNIIEVYGSGIEDGTPYIAMQLIEGETLSTIIDQAQQLVDQTAPDSITSTALPSHLLLGPKARKNVVRIGVEVANALQHAHDHGVLHRDIKPSNLLIDEQGTTFVSDFGLAKLADEHSDQTRTGQLIGTLRFLPPESIKGEWDERSDVYSLGLTLYELFALRPAFTAQNQVELLNRLSRGDSADSLKSLDREFPADLDTIIAKATAPEPGSRYQSAGALGEDLERFLDGRPILARKATVLEKTAKWSARNPALAGLLSLIFFAVTIGLPTMTTLWLRSEDLLELAESRGAKIQQAKDRSEIAREAAEASDYGSSMQLAQFRLNAGSLGEAESILNSWTPVNAQRMDSSTKLVDRRNWEWHYLSQRLNQAERTISSSYGFAWDLAIHPNDSMVAIVFGSDLLTEDYTNGQVILTDIETGKTLHALTPRSDAKPICAQFSPDGKYLVTLSYRKLSEKRGDLILRKWDLNLLENPIEELILEREFLLSNFTVFRKPLLPLVRFTPDGKKVLVTPMLTIIDTETFAPTSTFVSSGYLAISIENDSVWWINTHGNLVHSDLQTIKAKNSYKFEGRHCREVARTNDNRLTSALDYQTERLMVWNNSDFENPEYYSLKDAYWGRLSPDGSKIVFADRTGRISATDRSQQSWRGEGWSMMGHTRPITDGVFTSDGKRLLTSSLDGSVKVWNFAPHKKTFSSHHRNDSLADISFTPDQQHIQFVSRNIQRRFLKQNTIAARFKIESEETRQIDGANIQTSWMAQWPRTDFSFSPDGKWLAAPTVEPSRPKNIRGTPNSNKIGIWNTTDWTSLCEFDIDMDGLTSVGWDTTDANKRLLAVGGQSGESPVVSIFEFDGSSARFLTQEKLATPIQTIGVHKNHIAVASIDSIELFKLNRTGTSANGCDMESVIEFPHEGHVTFIDFSSDGDRLAWTDIVAQKAVVVDVQSGERIFETEAPRRPCCVRFSPDDSRIALSGYDAAVYLIDAQSGTQVLTLRGNRNSSGSLPINSRVIFSADGSKIATNDFTGDISVWSLKK